MTKKHSGLTRTYLPTFNLNVAIPSILEIQAATNLSVIFTNHITMNHKGLNWKIYRYNLTSKNYKAFLYAFSMKLLENISPSSTTTWQFSANAKRLSKSIKKNNIVLSEAESELLTYCILYTSILDNKNSRNIKHIELLKKLSNEYLG